MNVEVEARMTWGSWFILAVLFVLAIYDHTPARPVTPVTPPVVGPPVVKPPVPPPAPPPPVVTPPVAEVDPASLPGVAADYYDTFPVTFHLIAGQVRSGAIKDSDGLRSALAAHAAGFIAALEKQIGAAPGTHAPIADPAGTAAAFDQVYSAMGGK